MRLLENEGLTSELLTGPLCWPETSSQDGTGRGGTHGDRLAVTPSWDVWVEGKDLCGFLMDSLTCGGDGLPSGRQPDWRLVLTCSAPSCWFMIHSSVFLQRANKMILEANSKSDPTTITIRAWNRVEFKTLISIHVLILFSSSSLVCSLRPVYQTEHF